MTSVATIRNSTVSKLIGNTQAGSNIVNSRVTPTTLNTTPVVIVYTDSVQSVNQSNKPAFYSTIQLQIDVVVAASTNWADTADTIVGEIINTLMTDSDWVAQFTAIESYQVQYNYINDAQKPLCTAEITITAGLFEAY
jgi:hypothetical protein